MGRVIAGRHPVLEALRAEEPIDHVLIAWGAHGGILEAIRAEARRRGIKVQEVHRKRLDEVGHGAKHQGVLAMAPEKTYSTLEEILEMARARGEPPFIALLDEIEDPQNLGAILRSAEGAGVHGVVIPQRRSAGLTETVARASAGAIAHIAVAKVANLPQAIDALKKNGLWIFGADPTVEPVYYDVDFSGPVAVVVGSEGRGLRRWVKEKCDFLVRIPMHGQIESLNVSVAASLLFFEVRRQREVSHRKRPPSPAETRKVH